MKKSCTEKISSKSIYPTSEGKSKDIELYNGLIDKFNKIQVLDIGCRREELKFPGAVGLDIMDGDGIDVVHDLNSRPYPFPDDHFDMVIANHIFEHIHDLVPVIEELYRVMKKGGYLIIRTPFLSHHGAFGDPTHVRGFTLRSFDFFRADSKWKLPGVETNFKEIHKEAFFGGEFINPGRFMIKRSEHFYEKYLQNIFPACSLFWILQAVKE